MSLHPRIPLVSTDQIQAFVAFARSGTLRQAARGQHLSVEGLRARLQSLQVRLGEPLYHSTRGRSDSLQLTAAGQRVLELAPAFLELARAMSGAARS